MKKAVSIVMALVLLFPLLPFLNSKVRAADDVTGITLEKEIRAVIAAGVMSGYEDGTYKPANSVTREEFATFLARALELPAGPAMFNDVSPSAKLAPYIYAAAAAGIVNGGSNGNFSPKMTITRKDMALMISNALDYLKKEAVYVQPDFTDIDNLSSAHRIAIGKSVNLGIISGYGDGRFGPEDNARRDEAAAFIYRLLDGDLPEPPAKDYQTANIDSSGTITRAPMPYESFDLAKQAMTKSGSELVLKDGKIIYMKNYAGLVFAKPASNATTVSLYTDPALTNNKTYVTASAIGSSGISTELQYITSTDSYVKVYLGGEYYYMKQADARLVPYEGAKGRGYYAVSGGMLVHNIYNIDTNKTASYTAGPAPSFMQAGSKYYSWDGISFYNASGKSVGRAYQYFQFLSGRSTTSYTAAQLDSYIKQALAERQATGLAKYENATTKSKLIGLGTIAKKIESQYHVNALLIVSMAIHESDYGMSDKAQLLNNLFGIAVYDSDPSGGKAFQTVEEGVVHLVDAYFKGTAGDWRGGYFTPNDWRAYGAAPGNKSNGVNVKYASDPYWGAKLAGHMYNVDKEMGGKDFGRYTLAFTNKAGVHVRVSAGGSAVYTYNLTRMPVTITQAGDWMQVISDVPTRTSGYLQRSEVNILPIAK
ncbi:S-layer homology domain-containing protein [Domibacillus indicus]|uniref:S-layer homology domain-containing protein n=1 Tax=Domibacillus indicus TaxID=1437523 RepID=UPI00203E1B20|nr:S-layer homology domain-containing protein [Domibacillus indicus]MCM3788856.1 S-layer homology domain-containing protein [Domibacillus indicus]